MKYEVKRTQEVRFVNTPRGCIIWGYQVGNIYVPEVNINDNGEWIPAPGFGPGHPEPIMVFRVPAASKSIGTEYLSCSHAASAGEEDSAK